MYFDVDHTVEIPETRVDEALASAEQTITSHRGRVIAKDDKILVFSAPFWRVNGLLYLFVKQLPFGVSHGVLQAVSRDDRHAVRCRISFFWLRLCITAIVLLAAISLFSGDNVGDVTWWAILCVSVVGGAIIYVAAVIEARRFFRRLLLAETPSVDPVLEEHLK